MPQWITSFLNILFPARCVGCRQTGVFLCASCAGNLARAERPTETGVITLFDYADPRVRQIIWYLKYRGVREVGETLAHLLYDHLIEYLAEVESYYPDQGPWLVVPIPLYRKRLAERGFNQSAVIARALARHDPRLLEFNDRLLIKVRATKSQVSLKNRALRLQNLENAFAVTQPERLLGRRVILLDDVYTTGATMMAAAKTIRAAGAARIVKVAIAQG